MKYHLPLGVLFALLGALVFSVQAAIVKAQALALPLPMILFMQCVTGLILLIPFLFWKGRAGAKKILITKNMPFHVLRAVLSLGISFFLFESIKYIPFVNAMLLANIAPLIVPFIAYFALSQKINHRLWIPILIGFLGVALVLQPDGNMIHPAALLALGASFFAAIALVVIRRLSITDSSETIIFYFFICASLVSGAMAWTCWIPLSMHLWLTLIVVGVLYSCSQFFVTLALRFANPQLVSSLLYMNIVNSAIISALIWRVMPTWLTMIGIVLTIFGGVLCIRVEHQHRQRIVAQENLEYAKEN